jgi:hypothetical protein
MPRRRVSDWRRKPVVEFGGIETSGSVFADTPTPRWVLSGPHAEEDLARVMLGLICVRCWTPFPEPLSIASARRVVDQLQNIGRGRREAKSLVAQQRCPICTAEVSPEMAAQFFQGERVVEQRSAPGDQNQSDIDTELRPLIEGAMNRKRGARAS